jgi:hypothetical protein
MGSIRPLALQWGGGLFLLKRRQAAIADPSELDNLYISCTKTTFRTERCPVNITQLRELAWAGDIQRLDLHSLEGGTYVLKAIGSEGTHPVMDASGKVLHLRSVEHARDQLKLLPVIPFNLVHAEVHDEMCGMPAAASQPLRVPISMSSAW